MTQSYAWSMWVASQQKLEMIEARDERTVIFCDPDPVLIFKNQSKSNHSPKDFSNAKSKIKWSPKNLKNATFSQQKCPVSFPLTQSKSNLDPKFWRDLQTGSDPNSTKFAIAWSSQIQSNAPMLISDWSSFYLALVLPISKHRQEDKVFFDEQGGNVKILLSPKTVHTIFFYQKFVTC